MPVERGEPDVSASASPRPRSGVRGLDHLAGSSHDLGADAVARQDSEADGSWPLHLRVAHQRGEAVEAVHHLGIGRRQEEGEDGAEVQRQQRRHRRGAVAA